MKISDEMQQLLDDHIVMTQQISFSPYKGAFEQRIDEWEIKLKITSAVIEEWMDVQKYLLQPHNNVFANLLRFQAMDVPGANFHQRGHRAATPD